MRAAVSRPALASLRHHDDALENGLGGFGGADRFLVVPLLMLSPAVG